MIENNLLYDEAAYNEAKDKYIEENFPLIYGFKEYNRSTMCSANTLDEYLMLLVKGCINASIRSELDKHIMELLEDEWFFQWPLIHWAYATRLLYGKGCRKNVKRAVDILLPMAEAGCPGAMYDIGYCYMKGIKLEQSYIKAMYYWTKASKEGYYDARSELMSEYLGSDYKKLPVELQFDFICEIQRIFIEARGGNASFREHNLDEEDRKEYKKLCRQAERLEKQVIKKAKLREQASFFWHDDENPYKLEI